MKPKPFIIKLALIFAVAAPGLARAADNTNHLVAADMRVGGPPTRVFLGSGVLSRWYKFEARAGRSYCVEASRGTDYETDNLTDPNLSIWDENVAQLIATDLVASQEPSLGRGARTCFLNPVTRVAKIVFSNNSGGTEVRRYDLRVVDTTLFSHWYQVSDKAHVEAAPRLRNTTDRGFNVQFTARDGAGNPLPGCAPASFVVPEHGTITFRISETCQTAAAYGSAEVVHNGPPGALLGDVLTWSATTGMSLEAPFSPRQDW